MGTITNYEPKIEPVHDLEMLAHRNVEYFISDAQKAIAKKSVFHVAVSGGKTPKRFFELLGEVPAAQALSWDKIHLFWVDERYVPPDSQWSNYKLAANTFLNKVDIPEGNVHRIPTEYSDSEQAARCYEETIQKVFGLKAKEIPCFDLIVLGMGVEGHIGSLFPNTYAPFDTEHLVSVIYELDKKFNRITLTHPVLRAASHLVVLISGKKKAAILKEVLTGEVDEVRYPIHTLWPVLDKVTWLADCEARGLLQSQ